MKKFLLLSIVILVAFSCKSDKKEESKPAIETTVYYLIRHAEKDRTTTDEDPNLTEIGLKRANNWAEIFKDIKIDHIYSTDYKRTQQTAAPVASAKNLEILSYDPSHLYNDDFKNSTKGKTVLIVGHSNTTPVFVNTIIEKQEHQQMDDKDNGKLFIVTIKNDTTAVEIKNYN